MTAVRVASEASEDDGPRLWPLYDAVFGDQPDRETWLETTWDRHRAREGFRWGVAIEDGWPNGLEVCSHPVQQLNVPAGPAR